MDAETLFLLTIIGPIGLVAFVALVVHLLSKFNRNQEMKVLRFLKGGPKTAKEMADFLQTWESELDDELGLMLSQNLIIDTVRSPWDGEGGIQKPVTVYSLTIVGRQLLDPSVVKPSFKRNFPY